jgi:DNA-binding response OmpR family regulator
MNKRIIKRILVVDDESSLTNMLHLVLTKEGYEVATAKDGREGLRVFESIKPDLVITDIVMPDIEGIEFIRILMKKMKGFPIIVMSGNAVGKRFLNTARIFGVRAALQKPFMIQELKETIYRVNNEL